jgi:putative endopeptidase
MPSPYAIDPKDFDPSFKPADDFFHYINAKWNAANPIPPEESRWGAFYVLRVEVERQLKAILEKIDGENGSALDENARKVRDFYRTGMDAEKLEALKDAPLKGFIDAVNAVQNLDDLAGVVGTLHRAGIDVFWGGSVDQDLKKSDTMALYLSQSGLGLPDRDYYVVDDEKNKSIRAKYLSYGADMLASAPVVESRDASAEAQIIMEIERQLAAASMTRVELRDIEPQYNKMTPAELATLAPNINWERYFAAAHILAPEYLIVCQPKFMEEVSRMFAATPLADIKTYLKWHIVNGLANFLGETFDKKVFDFYGRTFAGATEMKPRWRRVLSVVNKMLDEAMGELYVKKHFSEDAKAKINVLVDHLIVAYRARIEKLDWMSAETKQKALAKLNNVGRKLGYPDTWRDISAMAIGDGSYVENYTSVYAFEFDRQIKKIGRPVDRGEWYMSVQSVNACYSPTMNEMLFPAAILQPPFFDPAADLAMNYGGIGTVIGHEVTHGFDDQGALFDANGNLAHWWTKEDKDRFDAQTARLAEHFDAYEVLPGLRINGKLTLGENIADLGGIVIAYDALALALADAPGDRAPINGVSFLERFFASYAMTERGSIREEALRLQVQTDPHSPSLCRVNGPLSEIAEFYEAFDVKEGDALWRTPDDRVKIW